MTKPTKAEPSGQADKIESNRVAPKVEWTLTDLDSVTKALKGMMGTKKLKQEGLAGLMGGRNLFSNLFNGKAKNVNITTFLEAAAAMGFEVKVSFPTDNISKLRLDALKVEKAQLMALKAAAAASEAQRQAEQEMVKFAEDQVLAAKDEPVERDEEGKLIRALTDDERAEVEKILAGYSFKP